MPLLLKMVKALRQAASFSLPLAAFHPIHSHTLLARDRFDIVGVSKIKLDIRSMIFFLKSSPHMRMTSYCQNMDVVSSVGNCQISHKSLKSKRISFDTGQQPQEGIDHAHQCYQHNQQSHNVQVNMQSEISPFDHGIHG